MVRLIFYSFFAPRHQTPKLDKDRLWTARYRLLHSIMENGVADGDFGGQDPDRLAMAFCGMMDMHIMARINKRGPQLTRELGEALVDLFMEGASAPQEAEASPS